MTDIVERLRCKAESPNLFDLLAEAADEIERLRAENERLKTEIKSGDDFMMYGTRKYGWS